MLIKRNCTAILTGILCLLWGVCFAQTGTSQRIVKLPAAINSSYEEGKPITTSQGDSLFFVRSFHPDNLGGAFAPGDIWWSTRDATGQWSTARNQGLGGLNTAVPNGIVGVNGVEHGLYFLRYTLQGQHRSIEVMYGAIRSGRIGKPQSMELDPIRVGEEYHDVYVHPDGNVLFISMQAMNAIGQEDIFVAFKDEQGRWTGPAHTGPVINSRQFEMSPFLSLDRSTLYFASDADGGYGDADIYRSRRLDNTWQNWSAPENVGPPVNSRHFDAYYFENAAGEVYFVSNRTSGYSDIFQIQQVYDVRETTLAGDSTQGMQLADQGGVLPGNVEDSVVLNKTIVLVFEYDRYVLEDRERDRLHRFLSGLAPLENYRFEVFGYTDASGTEAYNKKLSGQRADAVRQVLRDMGIKGKRIEPKGMGVYHKEDADALSAQQKRRVELIAIPMRE